MTASRTLHALTLVSLALAPLSSANAQTVPLPYRRISNGPTPTTIPPGSYIQIELEEAYLGSGPPNGYLDIFMFSAHLSASARSTTFAQAGGGRGRRVRLAAQPLALLPTGTNMRLRLVLSVRRVSADEYPAITGSIYEEWGGWSSTTGDPRNPPGNLLSTCHQEPRASCINITLAPARSCEPTDSLCTGTFEYRFRPLSESRNGEHIFGNQAPSIKVNIRAIHASQIPANSPAGIHLAALDDLLLGGVSANDLRQLSDDVARAILDQYRKDVDERVSRTDHISAEHATVLRAIGRLRARYLLATHRPVSLVGNRWIELSQHLSELTALVDEIPSHLVTGREQRWIDQELRPWLNRLREGLQHLGRTNPDQSIARNPNLAPPPTGSSQPHTITLALPFDEPDAVYSAAIDRVTQQLEQLAADQHTTLVRNGNIWRLSLHLYPDGAWNNRTCESHYTPGVRRQVHCAELVSRLDIELSLARRGESLSIRMSAWATAIRYRFGSDAPELVRLTSSDMEAAGTALRVSIGFSVRLLIGAFDAVVAEAIEHLLTQSSNIRSVSTRTRCELIEDSSTRAVCQEAAQAVSDDLARSEEDLRQLQRSLTDRASVARTARTRRESTSRLQASNVQVRLFTISRRLASAQRRALSVSVMTGADP